MIYKKEEGARFEIQFKKSREFAGDKAKNFEVKLIKDNDKISWQVNEIENLREKNVKDFLELEMTQREIGQELDLSPSTVNRSIKKLKNKK